MSFYIKQRDVPPDLMKFFVPVSANAAKNFVLLGPEPYAGCHFATYPTEIPKRAILAGTSARGCCPKCLAPWERVVDVSYTDAHRGMVGNQRKAVTDDAVMHAGRETDKRMNKETRTTGWRPMCTGECYGNAPIPCTVLDPFLGSGTTAAVAIELGRRAIGCELNPEYVKLIETRTNVTAGLALA